MANTDALETEFREINSEIRDVKAMKRALDRMFHTCDAVGGSVINATSHLARQHLDKLEERRNTLINAARCYGVELVERTGGGE